MEKQNSNTKTGNMGMNSVYDKPLDKVSYRESKLLVGKKYGKEMKQGNTVLDIGCGAGLDLYFASKKVGKQGKVYGIDISDEMVKKAKSNMQKVNLDNIEIKQVHSNNIPLVDESVDVVTSNGIYNLSTDKKVVFIEVRRILKPNGVLVFAFLCITKHSIDKIKAR